MGSMIEIQEKPASGLTIRLHPGDNVVIARKDIPIGAKLDLDGLTCRGQVPAGHKVAVRPIAKGEPILKYNVIIGFASADIAPGSYVHSHNLEFREFDRDYAHTKDYRAVEMLPESERATFMGIVRENGQVATRNFVGVLSTVNCSATVVHKIAEYFTPERLAEFPNVDGVVAFAHDTGCGMEMTGEPMDLLRRTMAGYARHANLASALIVGLGCERNQMKGLLKEQSLSANPRTPAARARRSKRASPP
jgi:altronate hydrolase